MDDNQEMLPNADTAKLRRRGDVREDGFVFVRYHPNYKNGEYWISPNRHAQAKPVPPTHIRNQDTRAVSLTNFPHLRIRDYRPRCSLRKRKLTQKEFDNLPYGPNTEPAMTDTENMTILPNYSKYGITPDGFVFRVLPASRGRTAGQRHRVTPVIHPRGHQWCVQITNDEGVRKRVPVKKLLQEVYGNSETIS
jgi:hypothetical protein